MIAIGILIILQGFAIAWIVDDPSPMSLTALLVALLLLTAACVGERWKRKNRNVK